MVKLLSHTSLLITDDVRLKSLPSTQKFCNSCDHGANENVFHLVMQCPRLQPFRNDLFKDLAEIPDGSGNELMASGENVFWV